MKNKYKIGYKCGEREAILTLHAGFIRSDLVDNDSAVQVGLLVARAIVEELNSFGHKGRDDAPKVYHVIQ